MEEGFVLSNKFRKVIIDELAIGDADAETISKKHHIPISAIEKAINDLKKIGLVKENKDRYSLTKQGRKVVEKLRRQVI